MPKLPALALLIGLSCASHAAADESSPPRAPAPAAPSPTLASLSISVGAADGFPAPVASAAPAATAATPAPKPDDAPGLRQDNAGAFWGAPVTRPQPARTEDAAPPAPGLLIDASTGQLPDGGPAYSRPPGAYAPYQSAPPVLEQKLDAAALLSSLQARGFTDVSHLKLRGSAYVCEATGPRRERVRLVVDAASGAIFGVEVIGYDSRRN